MTNRRLKYIRITAAALIIGVLGYAIANPAVAMCAIAEALPITQQTKAQSELVTLARSRIEGTFGEVRARPKIVFWEKDGFFSRLKLNAYGTTQFLGTRACVIIGPKGTNTDVVAHELMHAEIFERIGFWVRMRELPVWFDEGVAMQVDYRSAYDFPQEEDSSFARELVAASKFYDSVDERLTRNYAASKAEVKKWLTKVGATQLYSALDRRQFGTSP